MFFSYLMFEQVHRWCSNWSNRAKRSDSVPRLLKVVPKRSIAQAKRLKLDTVRRDGRDGRDSPHFACYLAALTGERACGMERPSLTKLSLSNGDDQHRARGGRDGKRWSLHFTQSLAGEGFMPSHPFEREWREVYSMEQLFLEKLADIWVHCTVISLFSMLSITPSSRETTAFKMEMLRQQQHNLIISAYSW